MYSLAHTKFHYFDLAKDYISLLCICVSGYQVRVGIAVGIAAQEFSCMITWLTTLNHT